MPAKIHSLLRLAFEPGTIEFTFSLFHVGLCANGKICV